MAVNSVQHGFLCNNSGLSVLMHDVKSHHMIKDYLLFCER